MTTQNQASEEYFAAERAKGEMVERKKHLAHSIHCSSYVGREVGFDNSLPCTCGHREAVLLVACRSVRQNLDLIAGRDGTNDDYYLRCSKDELDAAISKATGTP